MKKILWIVGIAAMSFLLAWCSSNADDLTTQSSDWEYIAWQYFIYPLADTEVSRETLLQAYNANEESIREFRSKNVSRKDKTFSDRNINRVLARWVTEINPLFDADVVDKPIMNNFLIKFDVDTRWYDSANVEKELARLVKNTGYGYEKVPLYTTQSMPDDPLLWDQWYINQMWIPLLRDQWYVWDSGVVIWVVDDGFSKHVDYMDNVVDAYNAYYPASDPYNNCSHGTYTAGILWASTDNGEWIAAISHNVSLMLVTTSQGCGVLPAAFEWVAYAANNGADIINMPFGWSGWSQTFQNFFNSYPDIAFNAAAWNDNSNSEMYPCVFDNVNCVAGSDAVCEKSWFSNYGSQVDITAPSTNILSTFPGDVYSTVNWTSMSVSVMTSFTALLMSNGLSADEAVQAIIQWAQEMTNSDAYNDGDLWAWVLDACQALLEAWVDVDCEDIDVCSGWWTTDWWSWGWSNGWSWVWIHCGIEYTTYDSYLDAYDIDPYQVCDGTCGWFEHCGVCYPADQYDTYLEAFNADPSESTCVDMISCTPWGTKYNSDSVFCCNGLAYGLNQASPCDEIGCSEWGIIDWLDPDDDNDGIPDSINTNETWDWEFEKECKRSCVPGWTEYDTDSIVCCDGLAYWLTEKSPCD